MILQLQAKVHGLGNLGVSTCTYASLSDFKATFWIPSLPFLPHDDSVRRFAIHRLVYLCLAMLCFTWLRLLCLLASMLLCFDLIRFAGRLNGLFCSHALLPAICN